MEYRGGGIMPKRSHRSISLDAELIQYAEEFLEHFNDKRGWVRFRSLSHFVEESIVKFIDELDEILSKETKTKR